MRESLPVHTEIEAIKNRVAYYFNSNDPRLSIGNPPPKLQWGSMLGSGSYAEVFNAQDVNRREYALKRNRPCSTKMPALREEQLDDTKGQIGEALILEYLQAGRSSFIPQFYAAWNDVHNPLTYVIAMELMDGSLDAWVATHSLVQRQAQIENFAEQSLRILEYLQEKSVVHADIGMSNILLHRRDGHIVLKLTDFGISFFYDKNFSYNPQTNKNYRMHPSYALLYRAPELSLNPNRGHYPVPNFSHDLYAIAVLMLNLISDFFSQAVKVGEHLGPEIFGGRRHPSTTPQELKAATKFKQQGARALLNQYSEALAHNDDREDRYFLLAQIVGWQYVIPSRLLDRLSPEQRVILEVMAIIVNVVVSSEERPLVSEAREMINEGLVPFRTENQQPQDFTLGRAWGALGFFATNARVSSEEPLADSTPFCTVM